MCACMRAALARCVRVDSASDRVRGIGQTRPAMVLRIDRLRSFLRISFRTGMGQNLYDSYNYTNVSEGNVRFNDEFVR